MQIKLTMRYHPIPVRIAIMNKSQMTSVGNEVEKENPSALVVGMQTEAATLENSKEVPKKNRNETAS